MSSSQAGDYFNLWVDDYTVDGPADPVETSLSGRSVDSITWFVPFNRSLAIFTNGYQQYELRSIEELTPNTAMLIPSVSMPIERGCQPVTNRSSIYFAGNTTPSATIYEYGYDENAVSNVAIEITQLVRGYVPVRPSMLVADPVRDTLYVLVDSEPNRLYIHQSAWSGTDRIQSAWFRWEFDEGNEILSFDVVDSDLVLLIRRDDKLWLESIPLGEPDLDEDADGALTYNLRLDRKVSVQGVYDAATNITTWTLPYLDSTITRLVLGKGWSADNKAEIILSPENDSTGAQTLLTVSGNYANLRDGTPKPAFVGRPFDMTAELSEQFVRDENGVVVHGILQLKTLTVHHMETGFYEIHVTPTGRAAQVHRFTGKFLGALSTVFGRTILDNTGTFSRPIMSSAQGVTIEIKNDTPLPCRITGLEFNAVFNPGKTSPANK